MADSTRLMLPFENEHVMIPETGAIVILRAQNGLYGRFPSDQLHCVQGFFPHSEALSRAGLHCTADAPDLAALVIVHLTRSKDENRANMARGYGMLPVGATMVVDGAKTDGIDSLLRAVKKRVETGGQESKSHGKVFWLNKQGAENPFADWLAPQLPAQNEDGWITAAGMFSVDGVDPGSAELASRLTGVLKGYGADLGAGWGWLAAQALATNPEIEQLDLFEAEQSALACARLNVLDPRATFHWTDATQPPSKMRYDFIVTNPPFHTGRATDPALGRSFIRAAKSMLKPSGKLYLVANRQLAYEATLDETFSRWEVVHQTGRYKVIEARKPKK